MKKLNLRLINPRDYDSKVITPEEILGWFENEDAYWSYQGKPAANKAHVLLTSGLHSDGFFDCLRILCYPNVAEILGRQLAQRLVRNGWLRAGSGKVDWVISSSYAAITFGHEVAKALGAIFMMTEKDEKDPKKMVWRRLTIPAAARVLQAEELITTSGTFQEVYRAVKEGNSEGINFVGPVATLVHRPPELPVVYQSEFGGRQVVALIEKAIKNYKPDECPYCKVGSPLCRPKTHWTELTGKK